MSTETVADAVEPAEAYDVTDVPDAPVEGDVGQVEGVVEPTEPPPVLNLDDYAEFVVEVGDGEFLPVTELKGGGLRQADYTKKTQEAAEIRKQAERAINLEQALLNNPEGTLRWLASELGVSLGEAAAIQQQAAQQSQEDNWWDDEPAPQGQDMSPLDQRLAAIEQRMLQEDANRKVEAEFSRLKSVYGDDFNAQEVAAAARDRGLYDPQYYELVFRDLQYERIQAGRQQAQTEHAQRQAAEEARRRQAAAEAASSTSASGSAVGENPPPPRRNLTTREAADLAWEQLGYG